MTDASAIQEHMEVIGADGAHVGTVDKVEGNRIKLTKNDSTAQLEDGQGAAPRHHYVSLGLVADVEGERVRLSASGANAVLLEDEDEEEGR